MVNFGPYQSIPSQFEGRNFYRHNPTVTLMRTTTEENRAIGQVIAEKLNMAKKNTALLLPLKGVSALDVEGQAFYGPEEDNVLFDTLKEYVDANKVEIIEVDTDLNSQKFAETAAEKLVQLLEAQKEN